MPPPWKYEPDESPKRKHHGNTPHARFVVENGELVGKCPSALTVPVAETLINSPSHALEFSNPRLPVTDRPDRIYVVHLGVVYRATPTIPGVSWHGFPEHPERLRRLPKRVREQLLGLADALGCKKEVQEWMDG